MASATALGEIRPEHDDAGTPTELVQLYYVRGFAHPIVGLWELLTEPAGVAKWFATMTGDPLGGHVTITTADDPARILEVAVIGCTSPHRLDLTITGASEATGEVSGASEATGEVSGASEATGEVSGAVLELRLHQVGVVTTLEVFCRHLHRNEVAEVGPYWQFHLDRLAAAVEGQALPQWSDYLELGPEYPCPG